jgi:hypothetical protein
LTYAGGPYNKGYILDWREIASRTTAKKLPRQPPAKEEHRKDTREVDPVSTDILPPVSSESVDSVQSFVRRAMASDQTDIQRTHYAVKDEKDDDYEVWDYGVSRKRGWMLSATWLLACVVE